MGSNPYSAYQSQQHTAEDPRVAEARALLRCAGALEEVQVEGTPYNDYCDALRLNQRLWTLFQSTLLDDSNILPAQIKDVLKGLSVYVDRRILKAFAAQNPKSLDVLININKEIAAGLMESVKNAPAPAQTSPTVPPEAMDARPQGSAGIVERV